MSKAYTVDFAYKVNALITWATIYPDFDPVGITSMQWPAGDDFPVLWDTGASSSLISDRLAKKLGLKVYGQSEMLNSSGSRLSDDYYVNLFVRGPGKMFDSINVSSYSGATRFDMIIGMDIIGMGDFAVTHKQGRTVMSFLTPSAYHIDFEKGKVIS